MKTVLGVLYEVKKGTSFVEVMPVCDQVSATEPLAGFLSNSV
jgi:hypothetical protein